MNTYYLKKFRKKAFRKYGIEKYKYSYMVIYRRSGVVHDAFKTLELAIEKLHQKRNEFILELVEDERRFRKRGQEYKLNKQLAKL